MARQEAQWKEQIGEAARDQRRGGSQEKLVGSHGRTAAGAVGGVVGGTAEGAERSAAERRGSANSAKRRLTGEVCWRQEAQQELRVARQKGGARRLSDEERGGWPLRWGEGGRERRIL